MCACAVFTCCANSHPFQERRVSLHEPIKIGRSVAQSRPSLTNAIFDCKVLSRNHALIWYENGKFFLQDTKSSNGTFVNSHRLSKGSEESAPREIFSNDTVQFGVDVMENSRKVTHSCIIATIQLFHPDGREATNSHSTTFANGSANSTLQSQELYQLAQCLQEALHREQMLENKLATLQRLVQSTQEATENGWQALIDEDRLLSRLEVLENQLSAYGKLQTEDSLRQELVALHQDKSSYETTAKESLRRVLEEKLEAVRKLSELERSLNNSEEECSHLQEMCQLSQKELQQLAEKYQEQLQEVRDLQEKIQDVEKKHQEEQEELEKEKLELQLKLEELSKHEEILQAKVESLQADNDFSSEQLNNMKTKLEAMKKMSNEQQKIPEFNSRGTQVDLVNLLDLQLLETDEKSDDDEEREIVDDHRNHKDLDAADGESETSLLTMSNLTQVENELDSLNTSSLCDQSVETEELNKTRHTIAVYKGQLENCSAKLDNSDQLISKLQKELDNANSETLIQASRISSLEEQLRLSDIHLNEMVASAVADLNSQLSELQKQLKNNAELTRLWQDQVTDLEAQLKQYRKLEEISLSEVATGSLPSDSVALDTLLTDRKPTRTELMQLGNEAEIGRLQEKVIKAQTNNDELNNQILSLREQLDDAQQSAKRSADEVEKLRLRVVTLQEELEYDRLRGTTIGAENMSTVHMEIQREAAKNRAEFCILKDECSQLRERIQVIESEMKMSRRENIQLKSEYNRLQESYQELEQLKDKLEHKETTWQLNLTDAQKEADLTKSELFHAQQEILQLKAKCDQCKDEMQSLKYELENALEEYAVLSYRSKTLSTCSMIPLLILLFAFVLAFYPFFSAITATTVPPGT